jgi:hypothetical protein
MQNGDRYQGKVVSLTADSLVLQSEVLGKVTVPRAKVAHIALGQTPPANAARPAASTNGTRTAAPVAAANLNPQLAVSLPKLNAGTNLIEQVRSQLLAEAGPEVNGKFDEMVSGLMNGTLNVDDIRAQAKSAADQVRSLKRQLGPDAGDALDGYLEILDGFLSQTAPPPGSLPQSPTQKPPMKNP